LPHGQTNSASWKKSWRHTLRYQSLVIGIFHNKLGKK
jgi:hypothetical protein